MDYRRNLYNETLQVLNDHNKSFDDVLNVVIIYDDDYQHNNEEYIIDKNDFIEIAKTINYDSGYGLPEINESLKILGKDWYMERREYDGSEWWEFKTMPILNQNAKKVDKKELKEYLYCYAKEEEEYEELKNKALSLGKDKIDNIKDLINSFDSIEDLKDLLDDLNKEDKE